MFSCSCTALAQARCKRQLIKNSDDVLSQCQYLTQSYAAIFISSMALTKGATWPLRGPLLKMKINGVEWGWVEVNIQSGSICGLICMEHEVPCWSETAIEGSWSSSYTKHPPVSPVTLPYRATEKLQLQWVKPWHCTSGVDYKLQIKRKIFLRAMKNTHASLIRIISSVGVFVQ